jgi:hypothetical protein
VEKCLLTVVGEVPVERRYYYCKKCGKGCLPLDQWAGLVDGMSTPAARRMLGLAGMSWSFDTASKRLVELCQLTVSNDTIRRVSEDEGQAAAEWLKKSSRPGEVFKQAKGEPEFYTDGITVNTTKGWRDLRLNIMDKREAGSSVTPQQWAQSGRVLPEPNVRIAWASLAPCEGQGRMWKTMAAKLGVVDDEHLSILADGQRWIWDQAKSCWKQAQWVLDVFHVSEHIHDCGKILFGESSPQHQPWAEDQTLQLIEQGPVKYVKNLKDLLAKQTEAQKIKAVNSLLGYLQSNLDSLWYKRRLAAGRPIGTGLVEGGCKTIVTNRLKLNNARWTDKHVEQMAALRCLDYSGLWPDFWTQRAA